MQNLARPAVSVLLLTSLFCSGCASFLGDDSSKTESAKVEAGGTTPLPKFDDRLQVKSTPDESDTAVSVQGDDCDAVTPKAVGSVFKATAKGVKMDIVEAKSLAPLWPKPLVLCAFEVPKRKSVVFVAVGDTGSNAKAEVKTFHDSLKSTKKPLFDVETLTRDGLSDAWSMADNQGRNSVTAVVAVKSTIVQVVTVPQSKTKASIVETRSAGVAAQVVAGLRGD